MYFDYFVLPLINIKLLLGKKENIYAKITSFARLGDKEDLKLLPLPKFSKKKGKGAKFGKILRKLCSRAGSREAGGPRLNQSSFHLEQSLRVSLLTKCI